MSKSKRFSNLLLTAPGYKERTEAAIKTADDTSAAHKLTISENGTEIKNQINTKEAAEQTLETMTTQLETETAHLKEHTAFHEQASQESLALMDAINKAINLLSSEEARKTMGKSVDKMTYPSFLQLKASSPGSFKLLTPSNKHLNLAQSKAMLWSKVVNA